MCARDSSQNYDNYSFLIAGRKSYIYVFVCGQTWVRGGLHSLWSCRLCIYVCMHVCTNTRYVHIILQDGKNSKKQEVLVGVIDINDSPPAFVRAEGQAVEEGLPAVSIWL